MALGKMRQDQSGSQRMNRDIPPVSVPELPILLSPSFLGSQGWEDVMKRGNPEKGLLQRGGLEESFPARESTWKA